MGFFNKLGRRIGKFEQEARAAAEDADWGCASCGSTFGEEPEACPDCGSERIVGLDADEEASGTSDAGGKASNDDPT